MNKARIAAQAAWAFVLLLCASAVWAHVAYLSALPDPIFYSDSGSYLIPAFQWVSGGPLLPPPERTIGYPLFLGLLLHGSCTLKCVLLVQHLLALGTAMLAAVFTYRHLKAPRMVACAVFALTAALPRLVVYAHAILTETLYGFCFMLAVLIFFEGLNSCRRNGTSAVGWGCISAISVWACVLVRPAGKPILLALAMVSFVLAVRRREFRWFGYSWALSALVVALLIFAQNRAARGFWGTDQIGPYAAFGVMARYVDVGSVKDIQIKRTLMPFYDEPGRSKLWDDTWVRTGVDGPVQALSAQIGDERMLRKVLSALNRQAVLDHPFQLLGHVIAESAYAIFQLSRRPDHLISLSDTVRQGMANFAQLVVRAPGIERWVRFQPRHAEVYFAELARHHPYPYGRDGISGILLAAWPWMVGWLPTVALVSCFVLWRQRQMHLAVSILTALIVVHIFTIAVAAGHDGRYVLPLEPLYLVLLGGMAGQSFGVQYSRINVS